MDGLFHFPEATRPCPDVDVWMRAHAGDLGSTAARWLQCMRNSGPDVRELLHDGHPTACVGDAAFAYVDVFSAHVNVGFYRGADLPDPAQLLLGKGKRMRHVKLKPGEPVDVGALSALIAAAYADMHSRLAHHGA